MITTNINLAKDRILQNELVAIPTETVYGLAARYDSEEAVKKIFFLKERPFFDPLIVHVSSIEQARRLVLEWPTVADVLTKKFWPGPLTVVLEKSSLVNPIITSGLSTVGIRMPNHAMTLDLISVTRLPLAAPSANKFGRTSPTSAKHVADEFKMHDLTIIDGGECQVGIESTVLLIEMKNQVPHLSILRKGSILRSDIEDYLKSLNLNHVFTTEVQKEKSPGHMKHHYMPSVPLIICRNSHMDISAVLNEFEKHKSELPQIVEGVKIQIPSQRLNNPSVLSLTENSTQAARILYQKLREASEIGADSILFFEKPELYSEDWEPVLERLHKAATYIID